MVTLALAIAFVVQLAAPSRAAAEQPDPGPVLQTPEARAAWGYLEQEAEALLASQGLSAQMSETQARGLLRSYILLRIVGIIKNPHPPGQDQAALSYLQSLVITEQYYSAWTRTTPGRLGPMTIRVPERDLNWVVWEGGNAACGFWQLFGEHPNGRPSHCRL